MIIIILHAKNKCIYCVSFCLTRSADHPLLLARWGRRQAPIMTNIVLKSKNALCLYLDRDLRTHL